MANRENLYLEQGTTFSEIVILQNDDGTSVNTDMYTARSQIRKHYDSDIHYTINTALSNGTLTLSMSAIETANVPHGRFVYDVELVDVSNNVIRILEGTITVAPEVTKV